MLRKISLLAILAIFGLGLVAFAGCGDDDESDAPASTTTTETTDTGSTDDSGDTEDPADDSGDSETPGADTELPEEAIDQAVSACNSSVDAQTTLSGDLKGKLEELCDKIADAKTLGDIQDASKEVCVEIVNETVPDSAGSAKDTALEACDQAAGG